MSEKVIRWNAGAGRCISEGQRRFGSGSSSRRVAGHLPLIVVFTLVSSDFGCMTSQPKIDPSFPALFV